MNILLIKGGWSSEREISLKGAVKIANVLRERGHNVTEFDLSERFDNLCAVAQKHDFAFIILHGAPGEDGLVQAMLDAVHCPYQGSGPAGSFLALNKAAAKQIFRLSGIPTPDWEFLPEMPPEDWRPSLAWPIFAKSDTGGSSLDLFRVADMNELRTALAKILAHGPAILESALAATDITCAVLGEKALPPVLIKPRRGEYFDFESKYHPEGAEELCPAPVHDKVTEKCQELALACHKALGLSGISRTDMLLDASGNLVVLETNTLPGMTATSLVPREAACAGLDYGELLEELIQMGLRDKQRRLANA